MYKKIQHCLCCKNPNLFIILDLNTQPPANNFHSKDVTLESYELKLMGCDICWHAQLSIAVDPRELFSNYLYVSGTSQTLKKYFVKFADHYSKILGTGKILDIACNDGTQLTEFKNLGWDTYGVDPAQNLAPIAIEKEHKIICDFWNSQTANTLPKFDLITAQNVFAHTAEIDEFLKACKIVMHGKTMLVIQTSQAEMFQRNEFDTIYHEHISFFSTSSLIDIANRHGLYLNNVYVSDIHGGSYVFELALYQDFNQNVDNRLKYESSRYHKEFYNTYRNNAMRCLNDLKDYIIEQKSQGKKVIGYGAAAKGMTVLNAGNITLDYIVDDNELKQNLLTPGMNIPVYNTKCLKLELEDLIIVPLAWNFYSEIISKVRALRPERYDIFIKYFPNFKIDNCV